MTPETINIYCDESTHLPRDGHPFLVLGALSCPKSKTREISQRIFEIREKHSISHDFEIKWTKVSPAKLAFYLELIDYFFDDDDLNFRVLVAPKGKLNHGNFQQTHDDWYYKMMFLLVRRLIRPNSPIHIYLDKKDTRSGLKVEKLHDVVSNSAFDFNRRVIQRVQIVESHHVNQMQLADLLIGAVNYINRGLCASSAKVALVDRIRKRSSYSLTTSTLPSETKFNVFLWRPQEG